MGTSPKKNRRDSKPHSTAMSLKAAADFSTPEVKTLMLMPRHGGAG